MDTTTDRARLFWEKVRKAAESREREGTDEMVEEAKKLLGGDAPIVDADSTSVTLAGPPDTSGDMRLEWMRGGNSLTPNFWYGGIEVRHLADLVCAVELRTRERRGHDG